MAMDTEKYLTINGRLIEVTYGRKFYQINKKGSFKVQ